MSAKKRHAPVYSEEGGGVVVTCACNWLRFAPHKAKAEAFYRDHLPKESRAAA